MEKEKQERLTKEEFQALLNGIQDGVLITLVLEIIPLKKKERRDGGEESV